MKNEEWRVKNSGSVAVARGEELGVGERRSGGEV